MSVVFSEIFKFIINKHLQSVGGVKGPRGSHECFRGMLSDSESSKASFPQIIFLMEKIDSRRNRRKYLGPSDKAIASE